MKQAMIIVLVIMSTLTLVGCNNYGYIWLKDGATPTSLGQDTADCQQRMEALYSRLNRMAQSDIAHRVMALQENFHCMEAKGYRLADP
jgi:hypothetical protein